MLDNTKNKYYNLVKLLNQMKETILYILFREELVGEKLKRNI